MTTHRRVLGYDAHIPLAGFQWLQPKELGAKAIVFSNEVPLSLSAKPSENEKVVANPGALLIETPPEGDQPIAKRWVHPFENQVLFREFADLDPANLTSLVGFANSYGFLGIQRYALCSPAKSPKTTELVRTAVETQRDWTESIGRLRMAATLYDRLLEHDVPEVRKFIRWQRYNDPKGQSPIPGWYCDSHPDLLHDEPVAGRVWERILIQNESENDDPIVVGWAWLLAAVNQGIAGRMSLRLALSEPESLVERLAVGGKASPLEPSGDAGTRSQIVEQLVPTTLLATMWTQLHLAITAEKRYRNCKVCGRWFEISRESSGSTARRLYCSDVCRVRHARVKQARTTELHAAGRTPKEIATELETDLATIKKWIANSKPSRRK